MSENTVSLVTGAATGIGAAIVRRLAKPGVRLVVHTGSNREGAERVAREAEAKGAETLVLLGDVGEADVPARLVAETLQRFGRIDHLVNTTEQGTILLPRATAGTNVPVINAAFTPSAAELAEWECEAEGAYGR